MTGRDLQDCYVPGLDPFIECGEGACAAGACTRHGSPRSDAETVKILRDQYDRHVAQHIADKRVLRNENKKLRALLEEALGWLSDPSAYHGTDAAPQFEAEAMAALGPSQPSGEEKP